MTIIPSDINNNYNFTNNLIYQPIIPNSNYNEMNIEMNNLEINSTIDLNINSIGMNNNNINNKSMNYIDIKPNNGETNNMIMNHNISINKIETNEVPIKSDNLLKPFVIGVNYSFYEIIKNLEESKINFQNIIGSSCYLSSTLQGFVHFIFPTAIKNYNKNSTKKKS